MSERGAVASGRHILALDGVRGMAISLVLCVHFIGDATPSSPVERVAVKLANYGVWGVDLFFVLSGFLITGILLQSKGQPSYFRNFYVRRTLRIFPLYYAVLTILFVLVPRALDVRQFGLAESIAHRGWVWSYTTNLYLAVHEAWALPYVSHFWSLAVEEHFYLVWPVCVFLLSTDALGRLCVACSAVALATRLLLRTLGAGSIATLVLTPCRLDALCIGALLAVSRERLGTPRLVVVGRRALPPLACATFVLSAWNLVHGPLANAILQIRGTVVAMVFAALIATSLEAPASSRLGGLLASRGLRALGRYSYGLYVIHGVVAYGMYERQMDRRLADWLGSHGRGLVAFAVLGGLTSFVLAAASYELFEKHMLRLKERFAPTKGATGDSLVRSSAWTAAE